MFVKIMCFLKLFVLSCFSCFPHWDLGLSAIPPQVAQGRILSTLKNLSPKNAKTQTRKNK